MRRQALFDTSWWLILVAWGYFLAVIVSRNVASLAGLLWMPLFQISSALALWGGLLWLILSVALGLLAGGSHAMRGVRIKQGVMLLILVSYGTVAALYG